jgi:hypothetical protein
MHSSIFRLFLVFICFYIGITGCTISHSCNQDMAYPDIAMRINFYKVIDTSETKVTEDSTLSTLIVNWYNKANSIYYTTDSLADVSEIELPLSQLEDSCAFEIYINDDTRDTIWVNYTRNKEFVNYDCGYRTTFNIKSLSSLKNNFDSVKIVNSAVNDEQDNIYIYLHTSSDSE